MAREKTHLSIALKQGASYVVSRRCVLISLLVVALFSGLLWGIYGPKAPVPTLYQYNTTLATVEKWATPNAKCASGGSARNFTFISASAVDYECQNIRLNKQSFFTILIILGALVLMCASYPTDLTMLGTNVILVATGAISTKEGFIGFSSEAVLTVASMFILVKCLEENGTVDVVARLFLGKPNNLNYAMFRLCVPIAIVSMFVLTTPLVCMMIPVVLAWATRIGIPATKFLIPLSFACIIGGTCTVIGSTPNIVVAGLLTAYDPTIKFTMFDFMPVGAPATAVTLLYLVATANFVLPTKDNRDATSASAAAVVGKTISTDSKKARKFFCSFKLLAKSPMVGFTVARSGLLTAQDLKLVAVSRNGSIYPFDMEFVLEADDIMIFYGLPEGIAQMRRERSVQVQMFGAQITKKRYRRRLIEVVLSNDSPLLGVQLGDPRFQDEYGATVVGVRASQRPGLGSGHSSSLGQHTGSFQSLSGLVAVEAVSSAGESEIRLDVADGSIGAPRMISASFAGMDEQVTAATMTWNENYRLLPGDCLVIEAHMLLLVVHKNSDHFSLMREVTDSKPPITDSWIDLFRLVFGGIVLIVIIAVSATGEWALLRLASAGAMIMVLVKSITVREVFHSTEPRVLLTIISSFGIGQALLVTGLASWIASGIVSATVGGGSFWLLWGIWLVTSILGSVVGAYAVVVIMFPICVQAHALAPDVSLKQFVIIMLMGSSTAFITPLGYVTSIMVQRVGNHTFGEFAKVGGALQIGLGFLCAALTKYLIKV